jgi:hypothetical protein
MATHFSRLLRHAWVTVGLFLFPGHHTGNNDDDDDDDNNNNNNNNKPIGNNNNNNNNPIRFARPYIFHCKIVCVCVCV